MSKVIVITGAGSGFGRALARRFAADGDEVVLLGRTLCKLQAVASELGGRAVAHACDVGSPASVRAAFAAIAERRPQIDVLVNNAAIFTPSAVAEASDEHILELIATNLTGAMLCTRAALKMMRRGGHIISVSSESVDVPFPHLAVYQSTKAGLERFTLTLHRELQPLGIRATVLRAGQMQEEDPAERSMTLAGDPKAWASFMEASKDYGLNLAGRPSTSYESAAGLVRALVDLPADMSIQTVLMDARATT
ncbi:MAG TPA: SDR family oxidoreductase [Phenylobacterium sp.]|uniref:SDR family oxidoreductase n=1 Tax=Phenylobacterium sp. TaxID=1871053 RepID=UPI002B474417|nr:SDR family oxidoreductase [Phenylobacterium sp.]HKR90272.1 SDR family oxidoreductase [Phenylobacterium sp.]